MALPVQSRAWPRVQNAIGRWAAAVTGLEANPADPKDLTVIWAHYDRGELKKPYIGLQRLTAQNVGRVNRYSGTRDSQITITITATTGTQARLQFVWGQVNVDGEATAEATRDAVLAAIADELEEPLIFTASGTDDIIVTGKGGRAVEVTAIEGATTVVDSQADYHVRDRGKLYRVRIQLYAFDGDGADAIDEYADTMIASLEEDDTLDLPIGSEILANFGVGASGVQPTAIDITAVSGGLYERRLYFDVDFVTRSVMYYTSPTTIDSAESVLLSPPETPSP